MEQQKLNIAFFGSSIVSAYWNGAATYYRGIVKNLHKMGHKVTFFEPDILERQKNRDIEDPDWCEVVVYPKEKLSLRTLLRKAQAEADIIIKASGVGIFDEFLEYEIALMKEKDNLVVFWDVDAPATLDRIAENPKDPFLELIPQYDMILTYGGGYPVVNAYKDNGAQKCIPIYNALDSETHFPVSWEEKFSGDLSFLGNRLPDREKRVEEFFIKPAREVPEKKFLLGGSGWGGKDLPSNITYLGHVKTTDHNAFNCSPKAVLNISRDSMARYGFSPATRIFEAAGAGACIITDYWKGIESFFEPGEEVLVVKEGEEVMEILNDLSEEKAKKIGKVAYKRVLAEHTYEHRAALLQQVFSNDITRPSVTNENK